MGRPIEIANWIQCARKGTIKTLAKDAFKERWVSWWSRCNPAWRERGEDGHPVIGGTGDWSTMFIPGKNGFVNIIASLYALAETVDVETWARSVRDVRWVLGEVLTAQRNARYVACSVTFSVCVAKYYELQLKEFCSCTPDRTQEAQGRACACCRDDYEEDSRAPLRFLEQPHMHT